MAVYDQIIIPAATSGLISEAFKSIGTITIAAGILSTGEGVKVQYSHNGTDWQDLYLNNVLQEITPEHSIISLKGPLLWRVVKSVTANAVAVHIWKSEAEK